MTPRHAAGKKAKRAAPAVPEGQQPLVIEYVDPGTLTPAKYNPRTMTDAARAALRRGLAEFGFVEPVVARREDRLVIGGHQRLHGALDAGMASVPVVFLDGVSDDRAATLNVLLNNPAAQGAWDMAKLTNILSELDANGADATLTGFDETALEDLLSWTPDPEAMREEAEDVDLTPPERPTSELGQVYELGRHRLMCGDSTDPEAVAALMAKRAADVFVTDPPYAIYGSSTGIASDITDDKMVRPFFRDILRAAAGLLKPFGHLYVCCDWRSWASWWEVAKGTGIVPKNMIVWDKGGGGLGSNYANAHELLFFASYVPLRQNMTQKGGGMRSVNGTNIWRVNRVNAAGTTGGREHNAQKPVDLMRMAITNSSDDAGVVADLFGGSGTTLIAAEQTGRTAYLMEIDPRYCDVIRRRYADLMSDPSLAPASATPKPKRRPLRDR